jgi:hypothetical protein
MTIRFYILPINRIENRRGPKYFAWGIGPNKVAGIECLWSMKDYGSIDMAILAADIADADHDALVLNNDVYAYPENLDVAMGLVARQAFNTYAEAHGIPADWITNTTLYRECAKITTGMMLYFQRVASILGYPTDPFVGLTLNTQYRNIPNPMHDAMLQASNDLGYTWEVGNNDQIRKIFKMMADQWGSQPIYFGFVTL